MDTASLALIWLGPVQEWDIPHVEALYVGTQGSHTLGTCDLRCLFIIYAARVCHYCQLFAQMTIMLDLVAALMNSHNPPPPTSFPAMKSDLVVFSQISSAWWTETKKSLKHFIVITCEFFPSLIVRPKGEDSPQVKLAREIYVTETMQAVSRQSTLFSNGRVWNARWH